MKEKKQNCRSIWSRILGEWLLIFTFCIFIPFCAMGEESVVRVGYPIQVKLTEINEDGTYGGYTFDYLREIAQYTNWNYEYVTPEGEPNEQIDILMDMLEKGEIDIMGGMVYSDLLSEMYDYTGYNYGTAYYTLSVLEENQEIYEYNLTALNHIRVAVVSEQEMPNEQLEQFAEMSGFTAEQIFCSTDKEMLCKLENGSVDAVLVKDVNFLSDKLRTVCRFSPTPFYFAATKGNREVIGGLNMAITAINQANPSFTANLYTKYFEPDSGKLVLSGSELEYIENSPPIRVAMLGERAPIQYMGKDGVMRGISCDILRYIGEQTGLEFEFVYPADYQSLETMAENGLVDLVTGVTNNYELNQAHNYTFTNPYAHMNIMLVYRNNIKNPEEITGKRLALVKGIDYIGEYKGVVIHYDSVEKCLDAIQEGKADYCYVNSYSVQYYIESKGYKDLVALPQPERWSCQECFGVVKPVDMTLLSIMNKAIRSLPEEQEQHFLYNHAFHLDSLSLLGYLKANPYQTAALGGCIALLTALVWMSWYLISQKKVNRQKALANARYEQLSELSNEFLYEYNIAQDTLKLTDQTAQFLGCEKVIEYLSRQPEDQQLFQYIVTCQKVSKELKCSLPNGTEQWLRIVSKTVEDENKRPVYSVGKLIDIQQEMEIQSQLIERAQKDSLTHIYNAETTRQRITELVNVKDGAETGALFIMDVDYFKRVNDERGHYTGDKVLQNIARMLCAVFRSDDVIGRLGGDEFMVYMNGAADNAVVTERCREIQRMIHEKLPVEEFGEITLSVGVALRKQDMDYDRLYRFADQALYIVKGRGRNGFEIFDQAET